MTSGVKIFASESLLTLPTDLLAYLVEYYQELCQLLSLGCIFHQMASWQSARRLNVNLTTQPLLPVAARRSPRPTSREPPEDHEHLSTSALRIASFMAV